MVGSKWMELPRIVAIGSGVILELPEICSKLHLEGRALIITGPRTQDVMGKAIFKLLEDGGYEPMTLICSASKLEEVDRAESLARENGAGFLIGAGGGRSIDIAKLASLGVDVPFLSVPTAASHDGICSSQASLTVNGETTSIKAQSPLAIVADSKIISQAPARLLAAGCGDIISNYTAILDWQLAHRLRNEEYSEYASALAGMTASMIVELAADIRPGLEESARIVIKALISSGVAMSIAGSSRPASGSEHKFAHAMNKIAPGRALHGELCGLGTIMMMYLHGGDWKMIKRALALVGAPTSAAEAGLDADSVISALLGAHEIRPERYTILDSGLNRMAATNAAEATGII
ncbi:MAG: NAD(P)-dependent glycerol-1-phosphate dehydrogenase [Methanothrix sp.]|nr:NAD(P)-dependent glycerol-1-phosphate dehydrogenase [Methanothrix sp.]